MATFVCGRAGSGKTGYVLDAAIRELSRDPRDLSAPIYLIVPDQVAFYMESRLTALARGRATMRAQVLTFRRLAHRVREERGGSLPPAIRAAGKAAVFKAAYEDVRSDLELLNRTAPSSAFLDSLLAFLDELKSYGRTPEELAAASEESGLTWASAAKARDAGRLFARYRQLLGGTFIDPADLLPELADHAGRSPALARATVYVDGFLGFTQQELAVLRALWRATPSLTLTLAAPYAALQAPRVGHDDPLTPFGQAQDTFRRLVDPEMGGEDMTIVSLDESLRFAAARRLRHLEAFAMAGAAPAFVEDPDLASGDEVRLMSAATRRAEIERVAALIGRVRRDRKLHFADIVVVATELPAYETIIEEIFSREEIPYFLDRSQNLQYHPLAVLVVEALRLCQQPGDAQALLRILKTDLLPLSRAAVDAWENHVLATGLDVARIVTGSRQGAGRANAHASGQEKAPPDVRHARVEALVGRVFGPFVATVRNRGALLSARTTARAVWDLLGELNVQRRLRGWVDKARREGRHLDAQIHERAFRGAVETLDEFVAAFGDRAMDPGMLADTLSRAYEQLAAAVIPIELGRVVVTAVDRLRALEAEAVFLVGCVEGAFPRRAQEGEWLSDRERAALTAAGLEVAPGSAYFQSFERTRAYVALTRARSQLTVSYPLADDAGKPLTPSLLVDQIRRLFRDGGLVTEHAPGKRQGRDEEDLAECASPALLLDRLVEALGDAQRTGRLSPLWQAAYELFAAGTWPRASFGSALAGFAAGAGAPAEQIARPTAEALYGSDFKGGVSRLERMGACAFSHFAEFGLRLRPRERLLVDAPARGELAHLALHLFVRQVFDDGREWATLSDEQALEYAGRAFASALDAGAAGAFAASARARFQAEQVRGQFERAALVLTEHARRSGFRVVATEVGFGREGDDLPELAYPLPGGGQVRLRGRIDRVDAACDGDGRFFRIVDYKSSERSLSLDKLYHGLSLQLTLYARTVEELSETIFGERHEFGGMFYFPVRNPVRRVAGPGLPGQLPIAARRALRMRGWYRRDRRVVVLLDRRLTYGATDLFAQPLKKDGSFTATATALDVDGWETVSCAAERTAKRLGEDALAGVADVNPFRLGQESACTFCGFRPVCRFDPAGGLGSYRHLRPMPTQDVLARLREEKENQDG